MASEKGAVQLMNMLDKAVEEISTIDNRLGLYEKKLGVSERNHFILPRSISNRYLQTVADAVKIMSRKDSLIQVETANVQKLTEALGNLLVRKLLQSVISVLLSICFFQGNAGLLR